jgi:hypothetical protein
VKKVRLIETSYFLKGVRSIDFLDDLRGVVPAGTERTGVTGVAKIALEFPKLESRADTARLCRLEIFLLDVVVVTGTAISGGVLNDIRFDFRPRVFFNPDFETRSSAEGVPTKVASSKVIFEDLASLEGVPVTDEGSGSQTARDFRPRREGVEIFVSAVDKASTARERRPRREGVAISGSEDSCS